MPGVGRTLVDAIGGVAIVQLFAIEELIDMSCQRPRGLVGLWRGVVQSQLASIGCLEQGCPLVELEVADRVGVQRWFGVPGLDSPPEFVDGHVEVVQFDTHSEVTSHGSHLVTFDPCPEPEVEDHAQP